jgi:hypothetical protein
MIESTKFLGRTQVYKGDAEEPTVNEDVVMEVTDAEEDEVQISWTIAGDRHYVSLRMAELKKSIKAVNGEK